MKAQVDLLGANGAGQGELATYMLAQERIDPNLMKPYIGDDGKSYVVMYQGHGDPTKIDNYVEKEARIGTYATLRRDEWILLDEEVLRISQIRLNGIQDLVTNGLVKTIGNGMGSTILEHHTVTGTMVADLTMDAVTKSQANRPDYGVAYMPLPIIHVDYEINARVLMASRRLGNPLDTEGAAMAARAVSDRLENMLFTNVTYTYGSGTIYSYLNEPNRNQLAISGTWDSSAKTGAQIVTDVLAMKQAAIDAKHYGPFALYIPTDYETALDEDYSTAKGSNTVRQRILAIESVTSIKVIDTLPDDTVLLVQMTSDVVRLIRGMPMQNIQWQTQGNTITKYKVMTIQVPQVRSDASLNSGVVHVTLS